MINQENYSDSQGRQFVLTEQKVINGETWVFYQRLDRPDLTYSCLAEAFRERFFRFP